MNAKTELDPSLFEVALNGFIKEMKIKKVSEGKDTKVQAALAVRVSDQNFMDKVLSFVAPTTGLRRHNIPSREDWIESLTDYTKNSFTFDAEYKDHQVRVKVSGKTVALFDDCKLTTFSCDTEHTIRTFNILARGPKKGSIEDLIEVLDHGLRLEFKRGGHWKSQADLDLENQKQEPDGDTHTQTEMDSATQKKVERAKEVANKKNTDKQRGRN